jgi:hypothetical protein
VAVLFEGSERAVEAQLESARVLVGGERAGAEIWEEARARQADSRGLVRFAPGELAETLTSLPEAVVRPAAGIAFTRDERPSGSEPQSREAAGALVHELARRIERELDPRGVFAA